MTYSKCYLLAAVFIGFTAQGYAQTIEQATPSNIYTIPFRSKGNQIELELLNSAGKLLKNISVSVDESPEWIKLETKQLKISELPVKESITVSFSFSLKKKLR